MLTIKRIPDAEIIKSIYDQTGKTTTVSNLTRIKQEIKRDSYHWYKTMREGKYEYIHEYQRTYRKDIVKLLLYQFLSKQASLFELHKLSVTLGTLFDAATFITNSISNNATLSAPSEKRQQAQAQKNLQVTSSSFDYNILRSILELG